MRSGSTPTHDLMFRKGKMLVTVTFSRPRNANEVDTGAGRAHVEAQLK